MFLYRLRQSSASAVSFFLFLSSDLTFTPPECPQWTCPFLNMGQFIVRFRDILTKLFSHRYRAWLWRAVRPGSILVAKSFYETSTVRVTALLYINRSSKLVRHTLIDHQPFMVGKLIPQACINQLARSKFKTQTVSALEKLSVTSYLLTSAFILKFALNIVSTRFHICQRCVVYKWRYDSYENDIWTSRCKV